MKIKHLILIISLLCTVIANGQEGLGVSSFLQNKKNEKAKFEQTIKEDNKSKTNPYNTGGQLVNPPSKNKKAVADSAYYQYFIKRNGWFEGHGPKLTLEEASHLNCYYKFSKKNNAGHWTLMQAFDGYGNLTTNHSISAYILNQFDDKDAGANKEWKEKMQSKCQIEIIGSSDGNEVILERSLDALGNVVSASIPTKTGSNTYLYSYIDSWGRPAYLRTDSLGNDLGYANFVEVTRDARGFEILYKYTDRNGIPAKNKAGAYMEKNEYDDEGNQLKHMSLNILGNLMIDDYGNCGMEYTYDNRGNMLTAMSHNDNWEPETFSQTKRSSLDDNTCGYWYKYDNYGREIEKGFLDTLKHRCVNQYGVYRIVYEYNDHGLITHYISYDQDGNKTPMDSLGVAEQLYEYDTDGNYISLQYLNALGKLQNKEELCKYTMRHVGNDLKEATKYKIEGDSVIIAYHYECDSLGNELRVWPPDDLIRVDSVDARGNETVVAYYNLSFQPKDKWGFHKRLSSYKYEDKKRIRYQEWRNKDGKVVDEEYADGDSNGFTSQVVIVDTLTHKKTWYQYYYDYLEYAYVQELDENMNTVIAQYDITSVGEQARVGWYGNLHYKAIVEYDYNNDIKSLIGENEFGEPSYCSSTDNDFVFHYRVKKTNFDESGNEIPDSTMSSFIEKLPEVYCIEVTDTTIAYPIGLRNGDIILSYGDWSITKDLKTNINYFYLETILQANQSKDITLLRHHPESKSSEIITISNLPQGKTSDLGFYPHKLFYTQKEKNRLLETCSEYGFSFNQFNPSNDTTVLLAIQLKGGFLDTWMFHLNVFKDPGIVLFAKVKDGDKIDTWSMMTDFTVQKEKQRLFNSIDAELYLTQDFSTYKHITNIIDNNGMSFIPIKVSSNLYQSLINVYQTLDESVVGRNENNSNFKIKKKQLYGKWQTNITEDNVKADMVFDLSKGGKAIVAAGVKYESVYSDWAFSIDMTISLNSCTWELQGDVLSLDSHSDIDIELNSIDVTGLDEEKSEKLKSLILKNKEELLDFEGLEIFKFDNESFYVKSVTKKDMELNDGKKDMQFYIVK